MTTTRFRVEVSEQAVLPAGRYRIVLELEGKPISAETPAEASAASFLIVGPGKGRLTVAKTRPLSGKGLFPLEDTHEYSLEFVGKTRPAVRLITTVATPIACPGAPKGAKQRRAKRSGPPVLPAELRLARDKDGNETLKLTVAEPAEARGSDRQLSPVTGVARWRPVARVFPGTEPTRRTLVLGGIHGSEPHGARVADNLIGLLTTRGQTKVTTVVVPVLFPRTHAGGSQAGSRNVASASDRRDVEPNRNFPMVGQSHATARELGRLDKDAAELLFCAPGDSVATSPRRRAEQAKPPEARPKLSQVTSHRLLPETGLLLGLIEEFQPSIIVALHAHGRQKEIGNSSGIFVDPRPLALQQDQVLARLMITAFDAKYAAARRKVEAVRNARDAGVDASSRADGGVDASSRPDAGAADAGARPGPEPTFTWDPLTGNRPAKPGAPANVLYATTAAHAFGTSLGDWGPIAVAESFPGVSAPAGNRPGIPVFTIECPQTPNGVLDADEVLVESVHAEVIFEALLEGPIAP